MAPKGTPEPGSWLTVRDVAAQLGSVTLNTVYKWTRRGYPDFPRSVRLPNGELRVARREFEAWMQERTR